MKEAAALFLNGAAERLQSHKAGGRHASGTASSTNSATIKRSSCCMNF
jgi:hypothetical protein